MTERLRRVEVRPAGRGRSVVHEVDEIHPDTESCDICNLLSAQLDVERLGAAIHRVYCRDNARMHSAPDHSAAALAAEYARHLEPVS